MWRCKRINITYIYRSNFKSRSTILKTSLDHVQIKESKHKRNGSRKCYPCQLEWKTNQGVEEKENRANHLLPYTYHESNKQRRPWETCLGRLESGTMERSRHFLAIFFVRTYRLKEERGKKAGPPYNIKEKWARACRLRVGLEVHKKKTVKNFGP